MKKIIYLTILTLSFITFSSCNDNSIEPTDINYITLDEYSKSIIVPEGTNVDTELKIFTSKKMSSDTSISLTVTTSMNSENYTVPVSVTIPKGDNKAVIPINFTDNSLNRMGETITISFDGPEGYFEGHSKVDLNISVLCPSDLAGSWTYSDGNLKTVTITDEGSGKYTISGDNAFSSNYYFDITDACSNITITGGQLHEWGYTSSGSGIVSADKSTITLTYTADGLFTNRTMTLVKN